MANIAYEPVKDALERVKTLSADEETQRLAFVRERALHDEASLTKDAEARGETKGQIKVIVRLLNRRFGELPDWVTETLHSALPEQLELWSENILFADTLEQVFKDNDI